MSGYRQKYFEHNKGINGLYYCKKCGRLYPKSQIDIDHIVPKNCGGTDDLWNLQALCKHCNRSKQDDMSSTGADLAMSIVKNVARGQKIDNVGGLASNMVKKGISNAIRKKLK